MDGRIVQGAVGGAIFVAVTTALGGGRMRMRRLGPALLKGAAAGAAVAYVAPRVTTMIATAPARVPAPGEQLLEAS